MDRPEPLIYGGNEDDLIKAKEWITADRKKFDLITVNNFTQGFEHNVVVVFVCMYVIFSNLDMVHFLWQFSISIIIVLKPHSVEFHKFLSHFENFS